MLTSKDQEILRLTSPVKIVDSKAFDVEDQPLTCIETLSGLKYIIEPKKGILTDNEILKYAPESMAAARIRIKNDVATMDDYYLAYTTVPWKLASYYVIIFMIMVPLISILSNWIILLFIVLYYLANSIAKDHPIILNCCSCCDRLFMILYFVLQA